MPAEPRRNSRKVSTEDEIELKRARGEISCAECRRLKLKCDKRIPCGSCVRRGCTSICPNGSLSAGQGTRFILADTDQLHRKISEMSERIRQLEDALAIFQAGISHERHPLLRDELLSIKFGPEVRRTIDEEHTRDMLSSSIDALGTLTLGEHGESKYYGRSAGSETMLQATGIDGEAEVPPMLDAALANVAITFPLTIIEDGTDALLDRLEAQLPPQPRAWALCETFYEHLSWWTRPIKRDELIDDILVPIYRCKNEPARKTYFRDSSEDETNENRSPHLLATLYLVLALGALVDLTLPACSGEAELYYRLGRAALSLRPVFDSQEVDTVQALLLMAAYQSLCTGRYSLESAWRLISLAAKVAQSVGLHRDSAQWKLDDKYVQRRRNLFWELNFLEMIHCLSLGRPPSLSAVYVDCEIPDDEELLTGDDGSNLGGFWSFRHKFIRNIYNNIMDGILAAKAPQYAKVLEFDRQIRQTTLPNVRLYLRPDEANYSNPSVVLRSFFLSHFRSITMIHIHRTFFAQALLDNPSNPLASPYAPSFLAANRCASILLRSFLHHWNRSPELCSRFWGMWTHAFSASVILGSTVIRSPNATMAPSALTDLDLAVDFFERGSQISLRARQALPILRNLKERALHAFNEYRNRHMAPSLDIQLRIGPEDQFQDELAIFGGQTRVVTHKFLSRRRNPLAKPRSASSSDGAASVSSPTATSTPAPSVTSPQTASTPSDDGSTPLPQQVEEQMEGVHPSLMEYLSLFPSAASISVVDQRLPASATGVLDPSTMAPAGALFGAPAAAGVASPFAPPLGAAAAANGVQSPAEVHARAQAQAQAGPSSQPQAPDPLQFLNVLPDATGTAAGMGVGAGGADPSLFFGPPGLAPCAAEAAAAAASQGIFDGSFVAGELGEQWTSLMRETGFFPVGDAQGSCFRSEPGSFASGDIFPQY